MSFRLAISLGSVESSLALTVVLDADRPEAEDAPEEDAADADTSAEDFGANGDGVNPEPLVEPEALLLLLDVVVVDMICKIVKKSQNGREKKQKKKKKKSLIRDVQKVRQTTSVIPIIILCQVESGTW